MQLKENQTWLKVIASKRLKERFKDLCWAKGTTMTDELLRFMDEEIEKNRSLVEEVESLRAKKNKG